ncbi:MAG: divergent polysaccharide deacetylase family protein [Syntrophales bacterium]
MRRKKRALKSLVPAGFGLFIFIICAASFLYLLYSETREKPQEKDSHKRELAKRLDRGIGTKKEALILKKKKAAADRKQLAIVIDDLGYDLVVIDQLLEIEAPITFSILPHLIHSRDAAEKVHRAGREVLLHLPMEPHDYPRRDPGKGALFVKMTTAEMTKCLSDDIDSVPFASGVNNHMGSRFMEEEEKLEIIFRQLGGKGLFFVDSLTTGKSKARELAATTGIGLIERDFFIDNGRNADLTYREIIGHMSEPGGWRQRLLIGHPYPSTLAALKRVFSRAASLDVDIVPVSRLLK